MRNHHLIILKKPYLEAIIEGQKRVESRFTKIKHPHFKQVYAGDEIFLKLSSGPVCAMATTAAVKYFENLTPKQILQLKLPLYIKLEYPKIFVDADKLFKEKNIKGIRVKDVSFEGGEFTITTCNT